MTNAIFRVDWLHSVDQGIGADFLGNLFFMLQGKMPGNNRKARCQALWADIQRYYDANDVEDRLKEFDYKYIRGGGKKKPPKLRGCNAASCRALYKYGDLAAQAYLSDLVPQEAAAKAAAKCLHMTLASLSEGTLFRPEKLERYSREFALQYTALRDTSIDPLWRVKPKMHLFLELCSVEDCRPNFFWTYRDEDFGGTVSHQSKMKGCWQAAKSFMKHALDLFALKNPEPRFV